MANEFKVRKGLIVHGSGSTILDVRGSQGQLFSVTDSLSGSLFGISDISGIPIFEVFSDDTIKLGTHGSEAIIVSGSTATVSGSFSGSFVGDGSSLTGLSSGAVTSFTGGTNNRVLTATGAAGINGEANLTFDGNKLSVIGAGGSTGGILLSPTSGDAQIQFQDSGTTNAYITLDDGTQDLNFRDDSATVMTVDFGSERVGVGTTSPLATLTVGSGAGSLNTSAELFVPNNDALMRTLKIGHGSTVATVITDDSTKPMVFNTGGSERVRILSDGKVGIGTATPGDLLHIHASGNGYKALIVEDDARRIEIGRDMIAAKSADGSTVQNLYINPSGNTAFATNSGNVSIGTTSASSVGGSAKLTVDIGASTSKPISYVNGTTDGMYIRRYDSSGKYQIQTTVGGGNSGVFSLQTYGGNVGIGTTAAPSKLTIAQTADENGLKILGYDDESGSSVSLSVNSAGHARLSQTTDSSSGYLFLQAENYLQLIAGTFTYTTSTFRIYDDTELQFGNSGDYKIKHNSTADNLIIQTDDNKGITMDNAGLITLSEGVIYLTDVNTKLHEGDNNALRVTTPHGYVNIGAQNGSFMHLTSDLSLYVANTPGESYFATNIRPYTNNQYQLGTSSNRWSVVNSVLGNFSGNLTTNHVLPAADSTYNLGSTSVRYANVYADAINASAASTFAGNITIQHDSTPSLELIDTTNDVELKFRAANNYVYIEADNDNNASSTRMLFKIDGKEMFRLTGTAVNSYSDNFNLHGLENSGNPVINMIANDSDIVAGDDLGVINFKGNDAGSSRTSGKLIFEADGTWDATAMQTRYRIQLGDSSGNLNDVFKIESNKNATFYGNIIGAGEISGVTDVYAYKYYDSQNDAYYLDPSNTTTSLKIQGPISMENNKAVDWSGGSIRVESNVLKLVGNSGIQLQDNTTVIGDFEASGVYVGATNTSYDFYNNGTSYLNGDTIVDAALSITAGALSITGDGSNATTLTESGTGDFEIAAVDDIRLTAGGNDIVLRGASSAEFARLSNDSQHLVIKNITENKDISFQGNDGNGTSGVNITALKLDMSAAGEGIFHNNIRVPGEITQAGSTTYSIDLKDHSNYTWLRNETGIWSFQSGTDGDDWTQAWQIYVPNVGSDGGNATFVELGQRNTNDTTGEFKGIKIVKRTGAGVVDGDFQAGTTTVSDLTVTGNLSITGDIDSYNVNNLDVVDKLITIGKGQTEANSNGSGILVDGSNASLLWDESNNTWDFNKSLSIVGNIDVGNINASGDITLDDNSGASPSLYFKNGNDNFWRLFCGSSEDLTFRLGTVTKFEIDSSGNATFAGTVDAVDQVKVTATGTATLVLRGDSGNSGDTGQLDSQIKFLHDDETHGMLMEVKNYAGKQSFEIKNLSSNTESSRLLIHQDNYFNFSGAVQSVDGTVSDPAFSFTGFSDDGIYREVYDTSKSAISFATEGTRRARIFEAGIWSDSNVYASSQFRSFANPWYATAGTSGAGFKFENTADSNILLNIDGSGNASFIGTIGIGMTPTTNDIDIFNSGNAAVRIRGNGSATLVLDSDEDNSGVAGAYLHYRDDGTTKWTLYKETNNDFYLHNAAASKYPIHAKANGHIILMEDGNNLGIGNTGNPSAKLEVNADTENFVANFRSTDSIAEIRIADNSKYTRLLTVGTQFKIMPDDGSETLIIDGNNDSATFAGDILAGTNITSNLGSTSKYFLNLNAYVLRSGGELQFKSGGDNERARITSAGKFGIGLTAPTSLLHVSSSGGDTVKIEGSGSTLFEIEGSQGQLFSVTDSLSGSLFAVSDIAGIPILEVDSADRVTMGSFGSNTLVVTGSKVGMGTATPAYPFHAYSGGSERFAISGDVFVRGATDLKITGTSRRLSFDAGTGTVRTSTSNNLILQTNSTDALTLDTSQNATFAGDVTIGNTSSGKALKLPNNGEIQLFNTNDDNKFTIRNIGSAQNTFAIETNDGTDALTISSTGNVTFAGDVTLADSSIIYLGALTLQDAAAGRIGWNRNTNNGNIHDSNYNAFQAQVNGTGATGLFEIQAYDGSGNYGGSFYINNTAQPLINDYIVHKGDDNTKIGFTGNDTIELFTNGSAGITLDSSSDTTFKGRISGSAATYLSLDSDVGNVGVQARLQIGGGTSNSGNRSGVAILSGTSQGGTLNALNLINSSTGALDNGVALNFNNANNWSPTGRIELKQNASGTTTHSHMKFFTYGTSQLAEAMRITSAGKVGIGTTEPTGYLEVNSGIIDNAIRIVGDTNGKPHINIHTGTTHAGKFQAVGNNITLESIQSQGTIGLVQAGANRLHVHTTGDVGIGTTTPAYKLDVNGKAAVEGLAFAQKNASADIIELGDVDGGGAEVAFYDDGSSEIMRLAQGKVGIGVTAPDYTLDIAGNMGINDYIYHNGDGNTRIGFSGNDSFIIRTNSTDKLTVNSSTVYTSVPVGIGTTSVTATSGITPKLDVVGGITNTALRRKPNAYSNTSVASGEEDYYCKLATFDLSAANHNDLSAVYTVVAEETSAGGCYARIHIKLRKGTSTSQLDVASVSILDISAGHGSFNASTHTTLNHMLGEDSFHLKVISHSQIDLYIQKKTSYGVIMLYEDAIAYEDNLTSNENLDITYHTNGSWIQTLPASGGTQSTYMADTRTIHQFAFFTNTTDLRYLALYASFLTGTRSYNQRYVVPKPGRLIGMSIQASAQRTNNTMRVYDADNPGGYTQIGSFSFNVSANINTWIPMDIDLSMNGSAVGQHNALAFGIQCSSSSTTNWNAAAVFQF